MAVAQKNGGGTEFIPVLLSVGRYPELSWQSPMITMCWPEIRVVSGKVFIHPAEQEVLWIRVRISRDYQDSLLYKSFQLGSLGSMGTGPKPRPNITLFCCIRQNVAIYAQKCQMGHISAAFLTELSPIAVGINWTLWYIICFLFFSVGHL